ncbi:MAG TPA: response regulator, partial [Chloroflexota bacterium]
MHPQLAQPVDASTDTKTILVVEDDDDIRDSLTTLLIVSGFRVLSARNGREALAVLNECERPAVILLDLMMPEMDGWSFRAAQLRDPETAEIPVIVLTAHADPGDIE